MRVDIQTDFPLAQSREQMIGNVYPVRGGQGWREATEEEANDMAADAFSDMCEGEPPLTAQERYEAAWKQKQELKR
jgi:hypothetical protein